MNQFNWFVGNVYTKFYRVYTPWGRCTPNMFEIEQRIQYKVLSIIYKTLICAKPSHLHSLFIVQSNCVTHLSEIITLQHPPVCSGFNLTDRSFAHRASILWNILPSFLPSPLVSFTQNICLWLIISTSVGLVAHHCHWFFCQFSGLLTWLTFLISLSFVIVVIQHHLIHLFQYLWISLQRL